LDKNGRALSMILRSPTEHIEGFYTEEDALEWIELESASWLAKKKRRDT